MTRENWIVVIASEAKRSRASRTEDGLLRCARNDSSSPQAGAEALDSLAGILQLGVGGRIGCRFVHACYGGALPDVSHPLVRHAPGSATLIGSGPGYAARE
jgi:hypothetical protein